jgi:hypothetical protein
MISISLYLTFTQIQLVLFLMKVKKIIQIKPCKIMFEGMTCDNVVYKAL